MKYVKSNVHYKRVPKILDAIHQSFVVDNALFYFRVRHFENEAKENQTHSEQRKMAFHPVMRYHCLRTVTSH